MHSLSRSLKLLDYYQREVKNSSYEDRKNRYYNQLISDEEVIESKEDIYRNRQDDSKHTKRIRTTLMSAFLRNGTLQRITDWEFKQLFPLRTLETESADLLIGNQSDGSIILVVILPLRLRPETVIDSAIEILDGVRSNVSLLSQDIEFDFRDNRVQTVIAIEPARTTDTGSAIEQYEEATSGQENFYAWTISGPEGETIDAFTDFSRFNERELSHGGRLDDHLSDGIDIIDSPHVLPDFFYDTHHSLLVEHVIVKMADNHVDTDVPNTHFSKKELSTYFTDTLHGSDSTHRSSHLTGDLIQLWKHIDIISRVSASDDQINDGSTCYRFKTRKKNPGSIYDDISENYEEKGIRFLVELEAIEQTVEQFQSQRGIQSDLSAFNR